MLTSPFENIQHPLHALARAWGGVAGNGCLRVAPEDFQVTEIPVCLPDGSGEHLWLRVRKRNCNTEWVAKRLSQWAGIPMKQVSYAGMKDRHAVTEQWFSLHLPGKENPELNQLGEETDFQIEEFARHSRKLKRGALQGNRFELRIREWSGDKALLEQRLETIARAGVPNYFGEQRFGHGGGNLQAALLLFAGKGRKPPRHLRGLYLSAARSFLFNHLLNLRIQDATWNQPVPDDYLQLDGRHAGFIAEVDDADLATRCTSMEIHPTGPLWGRGRSWCGEQRQRWETTALADMGVWCEGLERAGLEAERRALRVRVSELHWCWEMPDCLQLSFTLPAGAYATMVLRECIAVLGVEEGAAE